MPVWMAGAAAALLLALGVLVVRRFGAGVPAFAGVSALALGAIAIFVFADRARMHDRLAERRALDERAVELSARALANAPLACLDGLAGDAVETACERALFARPETVASAVSYVAARLTLLADGAAFTRNNDPSYADVLARLRQTLEADRFGIVAQVLAARENCNAARCPALALLREPDRVRTNLKEQTFEGYVARYAADWATGRSGAPVADAAPSAAATTPALATTSAPAGAPALAGAGRPMSPQFDFPSAASIPPVSIMSAEPSTGATPPPAPAPPAQAQSRRTPPRAAQRPPQAAAPRQSAPPGPPLALPTPGGADGPD